jgi:hypothetical protein
MYKFSVRLFIIIFTFVIGVFTVTGRLYYRETQKVRIISPEARMESIYFKQINKATDLSELMELRKTNLRNGDIEIRVWRGFGLSPLEGIVLKRTEGIWTGLHIKTDNYYEAEKVKVERLFTPKSGWESFWKQITDEEILTLPQSTENDCNIPNIDGTGYVVEINQDNIYQTYHYPEGNGKICREAKQMEIIGEIIGWEFDSGCDKCKTTEWFACMTLRKSRAQ